MKLLKYLFLLQFLDILNNSAAQWCTEYQRVRKTRLIWNNGQRAVSKRTFFGKVIYKYQPYTYTTVQYYDDDQRISVCCDGYKQTNGYYCEPQCTPVCPINTRCIRPNVCECNGGYEGYSTHPSLVTCRPVCESECAENAHCSQPNTCDCNEGYRKPNNKVGPCEPICLQKCPRNATCVKPNRCACNEGYEFNNTTQTCQPKCPDQCPLNAICSEPDKCTCLPGYVMEDNHCRAICHASCPENAACTKPNQCECFEGYKLRESDKGSSECSPTCKASCTENSFCSQPNHCECNTGYEMSSNGTCDPVCQPSCAENAVCRAPHTCNCRQGYHLASTNMCEPLCEPKCVNGICIEPNVCRCYDNFEPTKSGEALNNSNCQSLETTTPQDLTTEAKSSSPEFERLISHTPVANEHELNETTLEPFYENISFMAATSSMAPTHTCSDMCQCWLEYDELGPLSGKPKCISPCKDAFSEHCLNLSLCRCDISKMQLLCRTEDDPDDDPLVYVCKMQRTQLARQEVSNTTNRADSSKSWIIFTSVLVACALLILVVLGYRKFCRFEAPVEEYEL